MPQASHVLIEVIFDEKQEKMEGQVEDNVHTSTNGSWGIFDPEEAGCADFLNTHLDTAA